MDDQRCILHICKRAVWEAALQVGSYEGDTLASEGFIHCSTSEQVVDVADCRFKGVRDLLLLVIDPRQVRPEVKYEEAANGQHYPHIYGPLNIDAVVSAVAFPPQADGTFRLPDLGGATGV